MKQPHIVIMVMDCARPRNFSCYGYHRPTTPHFDALAQEAVLYRQAIAPSSWTLPTHASLFTGTHLSRHRLGCEGTRLGDDLITLAEFLGARGYLTGGFSFNPWISSLTGLDRGFQTFETEKKVSLPARINRWWTRSRRPEGSKKDPAWKGKDTPLPQPRSRPQNKLYKALYWLASRHKDKGARALNSAMQSWLNQVEPEEKPFFLFVNYLEPHGVYCAPVPYRDRFLTPELRRRKAWLVNQDHIRYMLGEVPMEDLDFAVLEALYDGELNYLDHQMQDMWSFFKERGWWDNMLLIILSDHGENLGDHGLMGHIWSLHETLIQVPLAIKFPRPERKSGVEDRLFRTVDLASLIADWVGSADSDFAAQGKEYREQEIAPEEVVVSELLPANLPRGRYPEERWSRYNQALLSLRSETTKYVYSSRGTESLFRIQEDPQEERDLSAQHPSELATWRARAQPWIERLMATEAPASTLEIDEASYEHLRSLGYL